MDKTLLTTILLAVVVPGALAACEPDCSMGTTGDKVEDPMNCYNYYICLGPDIPSDAPVACPDPNVFDPVNGVCHAGTCNTTCTSNCQLSCSLNNSINIIPDPSDCGAFKVCVIGGVADSIPCPSDVPYFDGENCVKSQDSCCVPFCSPYCYTGAVEVPDPHDCTSYYICVDGKLSNATHHQCDPNEVFDIALGRCSADAECVTLCGDSTSTTSSTITTTNSGCKESLTCPSAGSFARCDTCSDTYFLCGGPNEQGQIKNCNEGFLFNTNPAFPSCVVADRCPYYPSQ